MSSPARWLTLVLVSSALAVLAAVGAGGDALTMIQLVWFFAVIPGLPYVRMLRNDRDPVALWLTAGGLSLALGALVAEALLYLHAFSAIATVSVLAGIACVGAVIGWLRAPEDDRVSAGSSRVER